MKGHHAAEVRRESAQIKAERLIAEELKARGWQRSELKRRRKSDPEKLALAARLRQQTTLTIKEIANLLVLGSYGSANARLHQWMKTNKTNGKIVGKKKRRQKYAKARD